MSLMFNLRQERFPVSDEPNHENVRC